MPIRGAATRYVVVMNLRYYHMISAPAVGFDALPDIHPGFLSYGSLFIHMVVYVGY